MKRPILLFVIAGIASAQSYPSVAAYLNAQMSSSPTGIPVNNLYPTISSAAIPPLATPGMQILALFILNLGSAQDNNASTGSPSCTSRWGAAPSQGCGQGIFTTAQAQAMIDQAVRLGMKAIEVNVDPYLWCVNDTYTQNARAELIALIGPGGYAQGQMGLRVSVKLSYTVGALGLAGVSLFGWPSGTIINAVTGSGGTTYSIDTLLNTTPTGTHGWLTASTVMGSIANDLKVQLFCPMNEPSSFLNNYTGISGTCASLATNLGTFFGDANTLIVAASSGTTPTEVFDDLESGCSLSIWQHSSPAPGEIGFDIYSTDPNADGSGLVSTIPAGLGTIGFMRSQLISNGYAGKFFMAEIGNPSFVNSTTCTGAGCGNLEGNADFMNGNIIWSAMVTGLNRDITAQLSLWASAQGMTEVYLFPTGAQATAQIIASAKNGIDGTASGITCNNSVTAGICSTTWPAVVAKALSVGLLTISSATQAAPIVLTTASNPVTAGYSKNQKVQVSCSSGTNIYASNPAIPYTVAAVNSTTITLNNPTVPASAFSGTCAVYIPQQTSDFLWLQKWAAGLNVYGGVPLGI